MANSCSRYSALPGSAAASRKLSSGIGRTIDVGQGIDTLGKMLWVVHQPPGIVRLDARGQGWLGESRGASSRRAERSNNPERGQNTPL